MVFPQVQPGTERKEHSVQCSYYAIIIGMQLFIKSNILVHVSAQRL